MAPCKILPGIPALIEKTSPTYMRRLVKEIRRTLCRCGVYYHQDGMSFNARVGHVMFSNGMIHIKSHLWEGWKAIQNIDGFEDGYGQSVVASRQLARRKGASS